MAYYTLLQEQGVNPEQSREDLIQHYYHAGYNNKELLSILDVQHGIQLSVRHLKRLMSQMGLWRRRRRNDNGQDFNLLAAVQLIEEENSGSGSLLGCRRLLSKYGVQVSRTDVMSILQEVDPVGVEIRLSGRLTRRIYSNKGPNFLVHIDGYDKLKPFGFAIHAAICGFSRKVLWFSVAKTNNDPRVVAYYFLQFIREIKAVPRCIRADCGTENGLVRDIQTSFRAEDRDEMAGDKSFLYGTSQRNQRIERWWRDSRQGGLGFWIDLFKTMEELGELSSGNQTDVDCARFCFMEVLQNDLNRIRQEWNQHLIRKQGDTTGSKPDLMYYFPENYGGTEYKFPVDMGVLDEVERRFCLRPSPYGCDPEFVQHCTDLMERGGKTPPDDYRQSLNLYSWLRPQL